MLPARLLSTGAFAALFVACVTVAHAQQMNDKAQRLPPVTVTAPTAKDSVEKSYRKMIDGMNLFERLHAMAPNATLRFKLLPRNRDTDMDHIDLEILGDTVAIPLRVEPDHTFTVTRDQAALAENASVVPNRLKQSMTWRADIRTPGLPPNTRRLGDLQLECLVGHEAGLISNNRSVFDAIARLATSFVDYCNRDDTEYLFFTDQPLFNVTLVDGARREAIPADRLWAGAAASPDLAADLPYCDCEVLIDRTYYLPLGDKSWPDDTLVEFEYMDDDAVAAK